MKLTEEQKQVLESYLRCFNTPESVSDALGYDTLAELEADVKETYDMPLNKLVKVMYGRGLAEMRESMVMLAKEKPTALALLYKDLETRGLLGAMDTTEDTTFEIDIVDGGEDTNEN